MYFIGKSISIPEVTHLELLHKLDTEPHPIVNEGGFSTNWRSFSEVAAYYLTKGIGGNAMATFEAWYKDHENVQRTNKRKGIRADAQRIGDPLAVKNQAGLEKELKAKRAEAFENEMLNHFLKGIMRRLKLEVGAEVLVKAFDDEFAASPALADMSRNMPQILEELRATLNAPLSEEIKGEDF